MNQNLAIKDIVLDEIPEGEYGAGKLTKIDGGDCKIIKFTNAQMTVNFEGTLFYFELPSWLN